MIPPRNRIPALAWGLLLCTSCLYFFTTNDADPDLWGHVFFGRAILAADAIPRTDPYSYTSVGHAWVDHEWLAQVAFATLFDRMGSPGLLVLKLVTGGTTLVFVLWRVRAAPAWVWGGVGLLTVAVLARGFAFRPQLFTYLATALTLAVIDLSQRRHRRVLWGLPALFALWANLHGGFLLGLGILAMFAAAAAWQEPGAARRLGTVVIACVAATAVNPYGPGLLVYIWNELGRAHPITEWQPAAVTDVGQFAFFLMLAAFVATIAFTRSWRMRGWETLLAGVAAALALRHQRHTPVFALCAAAPLAAQLEHASEWLARRGRVALGTASRRIILATVLALSAVQVVLTARRLREDGGQIVFEAADYPLAAVRALRAIAMPANLAVPLEWGEYVLWFVAPRVKVSVDGRFATVFPERVIEDNFAFYGGTAHWRRLIDDYPTDAALVPRTSPCPIATLPGWQLMLDSEVARLYARVGSAAWSGLQGASQLPAESPRRGVFP